MPRSCCQQATHERSDLTAAVGIFTHRYGKIDDEIVYELLTERLSDFEKIVQAIEKWLSSEKRADGYTVRKR
ncbi:DUF86 domain-containing protein [Candidatus Woesearchaeota archaeon]|nr:DUF86 domain-containing protein [Candidatus Woesearchaeota archaeon]